MRSAAWQAAGLNLLPPGLQSIKDDVDKRKQTGTSAPQGSKIPKFEAPKLEAPSFSVPKLGPVSELQFMCARLAAVFSAA